VLGKKLKLFSAAAENLYDRAMDVLHDQEIKNECKIMQMNIKSGTTIDNVIDKIENII
jgi:glucuronate isomerase